MRRPRPDTDSPTITRTRQQLTALGLNLPARPDTTGAPTIPSDLSDLSADQLITLMAQLTAWAAYAGGRLAIAAITERGAESTLSWAQAQAAVRARAEKSVAAQKAAATADPAVREATHQLTDAYALRKTLEAVYSGLEASGRVLSRDLTRRTGMQDQTSRTARWSP